MAKVKITGVSPGDIFKSRVSDNVVVICANHNEGSSAANVKYSAVFLNSTDKVRWRIGESLRELDMAGILMWLNQYYEYVGNLDSRTLAEVLIKNVS